MSRFARRAQKRWTPEMLSAVRRFYTRDGTAMEVVDTDQSQAGRTVSRVAHNHETPGSIPGPATNHDAWKAREAATSAAAIYPLVGLCRGARLPLPTPEYEFHTHRKWRFDYAWPHCKVAVEVEGGVWTQGRHTRGSGFIADMEKYNAAVLLGWRVLRYTPDELHHALPALAQLFVAAA